jgi:RHS repeat-associated protein
MLVQHQNSRVCRKKHKSRVKTDDSITKYAHNSQAQRVFKTAPLYAVTNPEPTATPTVLAAFTAFFESLWSPITGTTAAAEKSGMSYVYDEDGTLIADTLTGGATTTWGQSARYIYLPTASGPMPVAAIYGTKHYAIQSDHLNTPRRLIQSDGQVAWQWSYSAFGDEQPTMAKNRFANVALNQSFGSTTVPAVTFNLRYPGQYFDQESGLHYNYHRSYSAMTGRYTQADPIGLDGGWNKFGYSEQNPLNNTDASGLFSNADIMPAWNLYCFGNGAFDPHANFSSINWGNLQSKLTDKVKSMAGKSCTDSSIPVNLKISSQTEGADRYIIGRHDVRVKGTLKTSCDCSWKFEGIASSAKGYDPYDFDAADRGPVGETLTFIGRNRCPIMGTPFNIFIDGSMPVSASGKTDGVQTCQCSP